MTAICPHCLQFVGFRHQRGCRLSDLRCPECRGPLQRAKYFAQHDEQGNVVSHYYGTRDGRRGHWMKDEATIGVNE